MTTPDPIRLDVSNMVVPHLPDGLDPGRLSGEGDLAAAFRDGHGVVEARRAGGDMGFFDLPYAAETVGRVRELADGFGQWFEDVVVLGIGGSGRRCWAPAGTTGPTRAGSTSPASTSWTTRTR